jgi:hypothetical protein
MPKLVNLLDIGAEDPATFRIDLLQFVIVHPRKKKGDNFMIDVGFTDGVVSVGHSILSSYSESEVACQVEEKLLKRRTTRILGGLGPIDDIVILDFATVAKIQLFPNGDPLDAEAEGNDPVFQFWFEGGEFYLRIDPTKTNYHLLTEYHKYLEKMWNEVLNSTESAEEC